MHRGAGAGAGEDAGEGAGEDAGEGAGAGTFGTIRVPLLRLRSSPYLFTFA